MTAKHYYLADVDRKFDLILDEMKDNKSEHNSRIDKIDSKIDKFDTKISNKLDKIDRKFDNISDELKTLYINSNKRNPN
jgi:archaellum component FlaC